VTRVLGLGLLHHVLHLVGTLLTLLIDVVRFLRLCLRPAPVLAVENLFLGKSASPTDCCFKNVLLVNVFLTILFLSATCGGRVHDKRLATPYPLPAGSRLLQDLGFLAFTLTQVEILMSRNSVGRACTSVNCTLAIHGASFHGRHNIP
jgi:hypothetical protein